MVKFDKFQSSLVKLSGSSSVDALINEIVNYINQSIKKISADKIDPSLLRFICNIVENSYSKKSVADNKIDKKKIVVDVYIILKPSANSPDDRAMLGRLIEDFHSSGQILKVSKVKYYYKLFKNQLFAKRE
jgi:hypothetical protein